MRFASPQLFWLLLVVVPLLILFLALSWRKKQKLMQAFIQSRLLPTLTAGYSPARQKQKLVLITISVALLFVALARPQLGFRMEEAKLMGIDLVIAIDTSRSMLASDLSPNRLVRAKMAARDLMNLAQSDRLALVAFAGSAFLQCPLTLDDNAFQQSIDALEVGIIPAGGSAISDAIDIALTAFEKGNDNHKVLVLFTDGEDHDSDAEEAAKRAAKEGLKIFTVGVGTPEGELIRITDESGSTSFLKDESGNVVKSRLNETLLQRVATEGNGFYIPLKGTGPMEVLYNRGLAPLPRGETTAKVIRVYNERFHWPVGLAVLLLLIELFWRENKGGKNASAGAGKVVALCLLLLLPISALGSPAKAYEAYKNRKYAEALAEYERLARKDTNDFRLHFNAGAAAYQAEEYEKALRYFNQSTLSPDLNLQQKGYYNSGNAFFSLGESQTDLNGKKEAWQQAITNFNHALKLNPQDADARNNLSYVQQMLQKLEEQQQQHQQDQKGEQNKEDKKNEDKKQQDQKDQQKQNQDSKNQKQEKKDQQQQSDQKQNSESQKQEQKPDQKEGQEKQQNQPEPKPGDQQNQQAKAGEDQKKPGEEQAEQAIATGVARMTREQAYQVLEAQRQQERTLIFQPPEKRDARQRSFKDW